MSPQQTLEARVRDAGDQVVAQLHQQQDEIKRVAQLDPSQWTDSDKRLIQSVLYAVYGLICSGRI